MLADLDPRPYSAVVGSHDVALMLDLSFGRAFVDAPLVWWVEPLYKSVGGEGFEDILALSPGGRRPHGGSFPFKRDVDGDGIVLGLLRHEDGGEGSCVLRRQRVILCVV